MPETIKALIVILFLSQLLFFFHLKNKLTFIRTAELQQWQFLWLSTTTIAFLSHNYWLFTLLFIFILKLKKQTQSSLNFSHYLLLLPTLPLLEKEIPGVGGIRFLFELSVPRLLSLIILLPIFLRSTDRSMAFLKMPGDKLFALFLFINIVITTRNGEITNILRSNFYLFLDMFLPYYAASRALMKYHDFQRISYIIVISASILAFIALFEALRGWHLYGSLNYALDVAQRFSTYNYRGGILRAHSSFSSGISLGYYFVIGLGFALTLKTYFKNQRFYFVLVGIITLGLITTLARGPWLGAILMIIVYFFLSKNKSKQLKKALLLSTIATPLFLLSSTGQKIVNMLPFIGDSESGSVTYRQQLLEQAWIVIQRYPVLGSNRYLETPEMQSLVQGQGIIDIVNSYLRIALETGLLGVSTFIFFFILLIKELYKARKKLTPSNPEQYNYANALISVTIAVLLIISTVSSIDSISHYYWALAGLISNYIYNLQRNNLQTAPQL